MAAATLIPAVIETCPIMFSQAVAQAQPRRPRRKAQKYTPPAVGYAEAISAIDAATASVKTLTSGQPMELATGPANLRPYPNSSTAPVRMEMMEKETAKLENPPISRKSCCA